VTTIKSLRSLPGAVSSIWRDYDPHPGS
jgi:hypothetical protein